eukprot:5486262-Prymnesium_polylepis.5
MVLKASFRLVSRKGARAPCACASAFCMPLAKSLAVMPRRREAPFLSILRGLDPDAMLSHVPSSYSCLYWFSSSDSLMSSRAVTIKSITLHTQSLHSMMMIVSHASEVLDLTVKRFLYRSSSASPLMPVCGETTQPHVHVTHVHAHVHAH